jgi:hypothetical protein
MAEDKNKEKTIKAGTPKVLYIGNDKNYHKNIIAEFKKYFPGLVLDFHHRFEQEQIKIQNLIVEIADIAPVIIYLDFTKDTADYLHLARLICRLNSTKHIPVIGLMDQNASEATIQESYMTGIKINHIKNSEMHAIVFHAAMLAYPEKVENHGFAAPNVADPMDLFELAKVGKVQTSGIQIECNRPLKINSHMRVLSQWSSKLNIMPSKKMVVTNVWNEGLFYNFTHGASLEFLYVEPFLSDEFDDPKVVESKKAEQEAILDQSIEKMKTWLETNASKSVPKNTRVLVIDNNISFYRDQLKTDQYPYMIRCQPYLTDHDNEIQRLKPLIIALQLESPAEIEQNKFKIANDNNQLKKLMQSVLKIKNYDPYVIIFNCPIPSKDIQTAFKYEKILTHRDQLYPDITLQMASLLDKKILRVPQPNNEVGVYLDKLNPASVVEISVEAKLTKISEADLYFTSNEVIYNYTTFRVEYPVPMFVTVVPEKKATPGSYYALIHGIGETSKNQLRKFINSVFFREREAAKNAEKEAQEKIKIDALKKKEEEAKKAAEAKNKPEKDKEVSNS